MFGQVRIGMRGDKKHARQVVEPFFAFSPKPVRRFDFEGYMERGYLSCDVVDGRFWNGVSQRFADRSPCKIRHILRPHEFRELYVEESKFEEWLACLASHGRNLSFAR